MVRKTISFQEDLYEVISQAKSEYEATKDIVISYPVFIQKCVEHFVTSLYETEEESDSEENQTIKVCDAANTNEVTFLRTALMAFIEKPQVPPVNNINVNGGGAGNNNNNNNNRNVNHNDNARSFSADEIRRLQEIGKKGVTKNVDEISLITLQNKGLICPSVVAERNNIVKPDETEEEYNERRSAEIMARVSSITNADSEVIEKQAVDSIKDNIEKLPKEEQEKLNPPGATPPPT